MELNRDLFLSELIINYLQNTYPNIYSDNVIIDKYDEYTKLIKLKTDNPANYTLDDKLKLQELNRYFYGNSDGSNTGSGINLGPIYISTVNTVKDLIKENDNAVRDIVSNIFKLLQIDTKADESFNKYLNELIIPGILTEGNINYIPPVDSHQKQRKKPRIYEATSPTHQVAVNATPQVAVNAIPQVAVNATPQVAILTPPTPTTIIQFNHSGITSGSDIKKINDKSLEQLKDLLENINKNLLHIYTLNTQKITKLLKDKKYDEIKQYIREIDANDVILKNFAKKLKTKSNNIQNEIIALLSTKTSLSKAKIDAINSFLATPNPINDNTVFEGLKTIFSKGFDNKVPQIVKKNLLDKEITIDSFFESSSEKDTDKISNTFKIQLKNLKNIDSQILLQNEDYLDIYYDFLYIQFKSYINCYDKITIFTRIAATNYDEYIKIMANTKTTDAEKTAEIAEIKKQNNEKIEEIAVIIKKFGKLNKLAIELDNEIIQHNKKRKQDLNSIDANIEAKKKLADQDSNKTQDITANIPLNTTIIDETNLMKNMTTYTDNISSRIMEMLYSNKITFGGNKMNILQEIYKLYYTINTTEIIVELLEIIDSNYIIYFILLISNNNKLTENIFEDFFNNMRERIINFYNNDVLLLTHYNENEIIYYIFINYIYTNYKLLLKQDVKDIIIDIEISNIKIITRENYKIIYKKIGELLGNKIIVSKLIIFFKKHINLPVMPQYSKTQDTEYLISFIYNYSKYKTLRGYDTFLTYIYLHILCKISNIIRINNRDYKIDIPSLNLYEFSDLRKPLNIEMTVVQQKQCEKILTSDKNKILQILAYRYDYLKSRNIKSYNCRYVINTEILDFIDIFEDIHDRYSIGIIDFHKINSKEIQSIFVETDDIIYNILYITSLLFKDNSEISVELYAKLVKYYLLSKKKKIADFVYQLIYQINKRINKNNIENILLRELSGLNIELLKIKEFITPTNNKYDIAKNIIDILTDFYNTHKHKPSIYYDILIPYLSYFYKYDKNSNLQYMIQDLLCNNRDLYIMYKGGGLNDNQIIKIHNESESINSDNLIDNLIDDKTLNELQNNIKKLNNLISNFPNPTKLLEHFNATINFKFTISDDITTIKSISISKYSDYINYFTDDYRNSLISYCSNADKANNDASTSVDTKILFTNELDEITEEITYLNNEKKRIEDTKTKYKEYYIPIQSLFDKIKANNELQSKPIIKQLYEEYIKPDKNDDKYSNPLADIEIIYEEYIKYINELLQCCDTIRKKLKIVIDSVDVIIKSKNNSRRGGSNKLFKQKYGGVNNNDNLEEKLQNINARLTEKKKEAPRKMDDILIKAKKINGNQSIAANIEKKLATDQFIDSDGFNIFEKLIATYDKDINNKDIPDNITNNLFYSKVQAYSLDPEEELEITLNDKIIFIVLCYFFRLGSLFIIYQLIDYNMITDISKSLFYYIIYYVIIFTCVLFAINIDTFKLRVLINYMNLHISTTNIWMHLILMISFVYLIYLLIINLLGDEPLPTELGDHEKIKLKYKLDLLTIIIYLFICILIFII